MVTSGVVIHDITLGRYLFYYIILSQVLNSLLQIVELAFKNPNPEMRKNGYLSWRVLMDNFALDQQVLSSSKRIKLITRPLVVSY